MNLIYCLILLILGTVNMTSLHATNGRASARNIKQHTKLKKKNC